VPCTPIPTNAVDARGELQGIDETALACEQTAERRCHSALTRNAQFSGEAQIANCSTQNGCTQNGWTQNGWTQNG